MGSVSWEEGVDDQSDRYGIYSKIEAATETDFFQELGFRRKAFGGQRKKGEEQRI